MNTENGIKIENAAKIVKKFYENGRKFYELIKIAYLLKCLKCYENSWKFHKSYRKRWKGGEKVIKNVWSNVKTVKNFLKIIEKYCKSRWKCYEDGWKLRKNYWKCCKNDEKIDKNV